MALDYTSIFTDVGLLISKLNSYKTWAGTTIPADSTALDTELNGFLACQSKLQPTYQTAQNAIISLRQGLAGIATVRLQDQTAILDQLSLVSSDMNGILRALTRQMVSDAQTIKANTVTLGSPAYNAGNTGTGKVFVSKVLDGYSSPGNRMPACQTYNGLNSELCVPSETVTLECIADSNVDKTTAGYERFSCSGGQSYPVLGYQTEGSGQGPAVTCYNDSTIISNKDFETWSSNTPGSFTISAGSSVITKESTTVFRGTYALKFAGDGVTLLNMTQAVSPARLTARRCYHFSIAVKASGVPAAGNLVVKFTGTGYTASSSEKIDIAAGSMPVAWTIYNFFINLPTALPSDWALSITLTGPLSAGTNVFLDSISFKPATYFGGHAVAIVAGSTNWLRGDRITYTVANNAAGNFQEFFRKWFGFQLNSNNAGAQTINDALAA